MKKRLILLVAFMTLIIVKAENIKKLDSKIGVNKRYNDAVTFVERGVKFHVFLNGEFDFNTHHKYKHNRRNRGIRIERNFKGQVKRIGNVFINYDYRGNVKRIGNIFMKYRFGQLTRVGNLRIQYDRWGNPLFNGNVRNHRYYNDIYYNNQNSCNVDIDFIDGDTYNYDDPYFYKRSFKRNYRLFREDRNYLYYKAKPNAKIGRKNKIIKRKKLMVKADRKPRNNRR